MRESGNDNLIWHLSSKYGCEVRVLSTSRSNMSNTALELCISTELALENQF